MNVLFYRHLFCISVTTLSFILSIPFPHLFSFPLESLKHGGPFCLSFSYAFPVISGALSQSLRLRHMPTQLTHNCNYFIPALIFRCSGTVAAYQHFPHRNREHRRHKRPHRGNTQHTILKQNHGDITKKIK